MGTLTYTATMSLDGFVADAAGDFAWAEPSAEIFARHLDQMAAESAEVLGRKTHELMRYWNQEPRDEWSDDEREFARRWQGIDKIVVSGTLTGGDLDAARERLVPSLGLAELHRVVEEASGQVGIFGPTTAAEAIRHGMVEDFHLFVVPTVVGAGLRAFPADAALTLKLTEQRAFTNGTVYLHYRRS
ncbi:dihydrofolate reductase family protein [Bogoriella caseilytica]|uniref:Dihydrofolate reductase n=1 Tax=Bogoriella caseilytica TaxID=56055 RepID=A0A3N2BA81_9MICO|nr:dihydrofolate reductase family protein [Bogoriella caseilytica]ROR72171.1 dihydrofolate reductase [Bogoriella caseilytica]